MIPPQFRAAYVLDTEFMPVDGGPPEPICLCARDLIAGRQVELWLRGEEEVRPPFDLGRDSLFIGYSLPAEWSVFLRLGWPIPLMAVDLFAEFRCATNGLNASEWDLAGALRWYGLPCFDELAKMDMQKRCAAGGPFTSQEAREILAYCMSDVAYTAALFRVLGPTLSWGHALLRGRYTRAVTRMEANGIPLDVAEYTRLRAGWTQIRRELIERVDRSFGVYDDGEFSEAAFEGYLNRTGLVWPRHKSGRPELNQDTFSEMAEVFPQLQPLSTLRATLNQLKDWKLKVGPDGRNRVALRPWTAKTGRNQPSTSGFIFGPAVWLRGLIRPEPGMALCYVDFAQQEFGIGAALSRDEHMMAAYESNDPYMSFAVAAGAAPAGATKQSHGAVRELFKTCILAVQYCMGERALAQRLQRTTAEARELLRLHQMIYPVFWRWSEAAQDMAMLGNRLSTVFGWHIRPGPVPNPRTFRNFPCQGNGSEILRLACSLATEHGIQVAAPVHDALLIEAPEGEIDEAVAMTRQAMAESARVVLDGFELRTDVVTVRYPERYEDPRGVAMWDLVQELLSKIDRVGSTGTPAVDGRGYPRRGREGSPPPPAAGVPPPCAAPPVPMV
jgi:hypothetical protein